MKFYIALASAALALAACGGPGDGDLGGGGDGGETEEPTTEEEVVVEEIITVASDTCPADFLCAGDVDLIAFDGTTLTIRGLPFDDDPLGAVYDDTGRVVNGFQIFQNNNPAIFNRYLALHQETAGGEITIGVVTIEGYQEYGYRGAWLAIDSLTSTLPTSDLVHYTGEYGGFMVFDGSGAQHVTRGDLAMEVDFTDSVLKGFITNREILDGADYIAGVETAIAVPNADTGGSMPDLVLNDTAITDGSFAGTVSSYAAGAFETGTYQGYFGGAGAPVVGGLIEAVSSEWDDDPDAPVGSLDTGVFIGDCASGITGCAP